MGSFPSTFDAPLMPCADGLHNWHPVTTQLFAMGKWVSYTDNYCFDCGLAEYETFS